MDQRTFAGATALVFCLFAPAGAQSPLDDCSAPVAEIDPVAEREAWVARDLHNIRCSRERAEDQLANPEFLVRHALLAGPLYVEQWSDQLFEPTRLRPNPVFLGPGARVADPFREPRRWETMGRGQTQEVSFLSSNGVRIQARLYAPNPRADERPLPAVVVTPGLQAYNELYAWLAEGLAEAGYVVLVIDPQGQGRSESFPHEPDGSITCLPGPCDNFPTNTQKETRAALDFLLSSESSPHPHAVGANAEGTNRWNPLVARIDPARVGLVGHSLGAAAVSVVGQDDARVKAIVAFDSLRPLDATLAATAKAPALSLTGDYPFPLPNGVPMNPDAPPTGDEKAAAFDQLREKGVDTMLVTLRAATHYEWSYLPFPTGQGLATSRYGERVSMHYTLAWLDRYLRDDTSAITRLTACTFDGSADASSIGQGLYDLATLRNVPYGIAGQEVATRLSFYFRSRYSIRAPDATLLEELDLRSACLGE